MGNCTCVSQPRAQGNIFEVSCVGSKASKGLIEVTLTDVVYVENKTKEDWHWPMRSIRQFCLDGDVFSFEAGRKCPGGEGFYAFQTKRASTLFDVVMGRLPKPDINHGPSRIMMAPPTSPSSLDLIQSAQDETDTHHYYGEYLSYLQYVQQARNGRLKL